MRILVLLGSDIPSDMVRRSGEHQFELHEEGITFFRALDAAKDSYDLVVVDAHVMWMHPISEAEIAAIPADLLPRRLDGESDNRYYCAMARGWPRFGEEAIRMLTERGVPLDRIIVWGPSVRHHQSIAGVPSRNCLAQYRFDLGSALHEWQSTTGAA